MDIVEVVQREVWSFQLPTGHLGGDSWNPCLFVSGPGSLLTVPKILLSLFKVDWSCVGRVISDHFWKMLAFLLVKVFYTPGGDSFIVTTTSFLFCFVSLLCLSFPVMDTWSQVLKMSFKLGKENCTCPFLSALQDSGRDGEVSWHTWSNPHLTLCSLLGVSFMYQHVWLAYPVLKPRFLQNKQGESWLRKAGLPRILPWRQGKCSRSPSPGQVGQRWCSSYWPDKAVKQTAKKTLFWLYSPGAQWRVTLPVSVLNNQFLVSLIVKNADFFFLDQEGDYSSYQSRASYFKMKSLTELQMPTFVQKLFSNWQLKKKVWFISL